MCINRTPRQSDVERLPRLDLRGIAQETRLLACLDERVPTLKQSCRRARSQACAVFTQTFAVRSQSNPGAGDGQAASSSQQGCLPPCAKGLPCEAEPQFVLVYALAGPGKTPIRTLRAQRQARVFPSSAMTEAIDSSLGGDGGLLSPDVSLGSAQATR